MREPKLTEEVTALREAIKAEEITIRVLRDKVDLLVRRIFGESSEALDERQLMLLLHGEGNASVKPQCPKAPPTLWRLSCSKGTRSLRQRLRVVNASCTSPMICR